MILRLLTADAMEVGCPLMAAVVGGVQERADTIHSSNSSEEQAAEHLSSSTTSESFVHQTSLNSNTITHPTQFHVSHL